MAERSLSMREVRGSIPCASTFLNLVAENPFVLFSQGEEDIKDRIKYRIGLIRKPQSLLPHRLTQDSYVGTMYLMLINASSPPWHSNRERVSSIIAPTLTRLRWA